MKKTITLFCLASFTLLFSGCVTRTYVDAPKNRGANSATGKKYGANKDEKVKSSKRVWIWQKEFRNPTY